MTNPYNGEEYKARLISRQKTVLAKMLEIEKITKEQYDEAVAYELVFKKGEIASTAAVQSYARDAVWKAVAEDLAEVMGGVIGGNYYKLGVKTVDLVAEAGYPVRYRKPMKGDKFWLGAGCFASVPSVGGYATLTANDVVLTPAEEAAEEGFCVVIRASKPLTQGNLVAYADGAYAQAYLVEVL